MASKQVGEQLSGANLNAGEQKAANEVEKSVGQRARSSFERWVPAKLDGHAAARLAIGSVGEAE